MAQAQRRGWGLGPMKWVVLCAIFLFGVVCLLLSRELHDHSTPSLVLELLGAFLVVAIPLEILRSVFFEELTTTSFVRQVEAVFERRVDAQLLDTRRFGMERIEKSIDFRTMFDELQPGDTLWWLDTFSPGHQGWIERLEKAVRRGASVEMLILDPASALSAMRAEEIGGYYEPQRFTAELQDFIEDLQKCEKHVNRPGIEGRLHITLYRNLLGVPCYIVERDGRPIRAWSSMYLSNATGVDFPHFYWSQGPMCELLYRYVTNKHKRLAASTAGTVL